MFFEAEISQKPPKLWFFSFFIPPTHNVLSVNDTNSTQNFTSNLIKRISSTQNVLLSQNFTKTVKIGKK